ncbi:antibiotic biosynthesis monooxygenase family protein [Beijerinckia indica]|uniref:Antibiotic biosynthesis monooxygenase n=1 Tax=Beijerinckia indica subsp. indica (strain ATCC 9039 / DSM 1715 / NCIMB 8712) TaxID=395963 RepID=B2IJU2_BEII9|nr:antibiotic biosynthesis monooxygenase [Beijerinckia indica]ACB96317.1 Antibiotic biosynthesis monooxygenase [Beijerinckia indica subsp. indica ATCC 9039]
MFYAMNRFKIIKGEEQAFEQKWLSRDSRLKELPGFIEFNLLRGPETETYTLYASHTVWASKTDFVNWTQSEQFRAAHAGAGSAKPLYLGHPEFEGFESVQSLSNRSVAQAAE